MKKNIRSIKFIKCSFLLAIALNLGLGVHAQTKAKPSIGDPAPELKYSKWIKGTPVTTFEDNRLYVLEFWATWCGPCKAAMPELSALAKKYEKEATFIGVNIWEKTGDKPYESSLPAVTKFVNSIGDKMSYNVISDNNDTYMVKNWMLPYGQNGIPATFLVKDRKIIWIGHPIHLDSVMTSVISGKYDLGANKVKFDQGRASDEKASKATEILNPIYEAYKAKDFEKALTLIKALDTKDPRIAMSAKYYQYVILLDQNKETEALKFGKEWLAASPMMASTVAGVIMDKNGLSKDAYLFVIEVYKPMISQKGVVIPLLHHEIASAYAKAGDFDNAIKHEKEAIESAKEALKKGEHLGTIMDYTVTEYQEQLDKYQKRN